MKRLLCRIIASVGIAILLLWSSACSKPAMSRVDANSVGVWLGIAEAPPLPPVGIEVVCDPTDGSDCTQTRVREQLHAALLTAGARPGSFVRAWVLGDDVTSLQLVGIQSVPASISTRTERAAAIVRDRYVAAGDLYFSKAFEPVFGRVAPRRSLIAESVTRVAWADAPNVQRLFVVITDGREYSRFARMECEPIPAPDVFTNALQRERVLAPGTLRGVRIVLAGVDVTALHDRRCPETIEKTEEIRTLWRYVLTHAGAISVTYTTGVADPTAQFPAQEEQ